MPATYGTPCKFHKKKISVYDLKFCFDSIPLSEKTKTKTLKQFKLMTKLHPLADYFLTRENLDVREELRNISTFNFPNDFEFHYALHLLSKRIPDSSTIYFPPNFYMQFFTIQPYVFLPEFSTDHISVAYKNELYLKLHGYSIPTLSNVKKIDGVPTVQYFTENSLVFSKDSPLKFSHYTYHQKYDYNFFLYSHIWNPCHEFTLKSGKVICLEKIIFKNSKYEEYSNKKPHEVTTRIKKQVKHKIDDRSYNPSKDKLVLLEKTEQMKRGYIVRSEDQNEIPFIKIMNFKKKRSSNYRLILNFISDLHEKKSPIAIIDVIENDSGDITDSDWFVNMFSHSMPDNDDSISITSFPYFSIFDMRITTRYSKVFYPRQKNSLFHNPLNGNFFDQLECSLNDPIQFVRENTPEQFSPLFFKDFRNVYPYKRTHSFKTQFLVITNGKLIFSTIFNFRA